MAGAFAKVPIFKEFKDYEKCYNLPGTMMKMRCTKACRGNGGGARVQGKTVLPGE